MSNGEKKRRRGPTPQPQKRREKRVTVFFSDTEHQALLDKLGAPELVPSYLRDTALGSKRAARIVVPELNAEAYAALARAAANLNQLARKLNQDEAYSADSVREALHHFRLSLIGAKPGRRP